MTAIASFFTHSGSFADRAVRHVVDLGEQAWAAVCQAYEPGLRTSPAQLRWSTVQEMLALYSACVERPDLVELARAYVAEHPPRHG